MRGLGTIINVLTVAGGSLIGVFAGHRIGERARRTIMQGLGLAVVAVGVVGLEPLYDEDQGLTRFVILIASMIVGGWLGETLDLEARLERVGTRLRDRFAGDGSGERMEPEEKERFVEGFVVASTIFCAGALTLLGAFEDGLGVSIRLLVIKSTLDGFAAIGLASVYGWGILASVVTIAVYQGALTALAVVIEPVITTEVVAEMGAIGSLLVLGIALRLLDIVEVRVLNLLPALLLGMIAAGVVEAIQ